VELGHGPMEGCFGVYNRRRKEGASTCGHMIRMVDLLLLLSLSSVISPTPSN